VAHAQIAAFARLAKGVDAPQRVIFGQVTKLSRNMHAIRYSGSRDEIYVTNQFAQSILTFRGGANGQEAPIRVIQGPRTHLENPGTLEIDEVNDEILVPQRDDVLVFPLTANGDVAPLRILHAGRKNGWTTARPSGGIAVDPVHNVLVIVGTILKDEKVWETPYGNNRESLLIFDRLAEGDTKPLRVIRGPNTGMHTIRQIEIQPKGGWIVISQMTDGEIAEPEGTFVGVWSIHDDGDIPPRWKIDGKPSNGMKKPHGIALDAKHKEVVVADMRVNAVLTFYFPEIF
jgi:DNA-binding beta-propeller fold protein YncE